jgi:hypothetical protein
MEDFIRKKISVCGKMRTGRGIAMEEFSLDDDLLAQGLVLRERKQGNTITASEY